MEIMEMLNEIDSSIFLFLNGLHADWLDGPMTLISDRWTWLPFYFFMAAVVVVRAGLRIGIVIIIATLLVVCMSDWICASVIRPWIERLRPCNLDNPLSEFTHIVDDYRGGQYGFPSCHAANTLGLSLFLTNVMRCRWIAILLFVWAGVVSYSRIYIGVHYPGDIFVGGLVGTAVAMAVYKHLCERALKWLIPRVTVPNRFYVRYRRYKFDL